MNQNADISTCPKCGSTQYQEDQDVVGITRTCRNCGAVQYFDRAGARMTPSLVGVTLSIHGRGRRGKRSKAYDKSQ